MYSPKRKIREDKYLITYILSIHDVCEEVFKDSYHERYRPVNSNHEFNR